MNNKKRFSVPSKYILFGLTLLCLALCVLSVIAPTSIGAVRNITAYVITPLQEGLNSISSRISDKLDDFDTMEHLKAENEQLRMKIEELTNENIALNLERNELEELRMLFDLNQSYSYPKIAAQVIARDSSNFFQTFTINKGASEGLSVDMNVISGNGLVGIITSVTDHTATVRSIIDDYSNVSAMVANTSDFCYVSGDLSLINEGVIRVENLPRESVVEDGYALVTSYISSKYLPGLLIGYTSNITLDANNLTKSGYVIPVVDFEHIEYVLVITEKKIS